MAFVDAYPGGRMPALPPVTWAPDGWHVLQLVNGAWGTSYRSPAVPTPPRDGDRAGLALLRDSSAWIGVKRDGGTTRLVMVNGLTMDGNWNTTGTEATSATLSGSRVWLRANADIRPGTRCPGTFSYSTDGTVFTRLGPAFSLGNDWRFFMGYRFALFNHAPPRRSAARCASHGSS